MDEIVRSMVDNSGVKPPEDDGYGPRAGLCLEPQNFPDAPNHSIFPKSRLDPGEMYTNRVVYQFAGV
jgi:aldose 1-epimerase